MKPKNKFLTYYFLQLVIVSCIMCNKTTILFCSVPASTCVSADQLQHFGHIADGSIRDDEDLPRVRALHGLLVHPGQRPQQVGASHVSSHPLDVLVRLRQSDLRNSAAEMLSDPQ